MDLSRGQQDAFNGICDWMYSATSRGPFVRLGGFAGSGKTTLLTELASTVDRKKVRRIAFATPTGKSSQVIQFKLLNSGAYSSSDTVGTIHSLIYRPNAQKGGNVSFTLKDESELSALYDLIVVDEASMVSAELRRDLESFYIPILYVGDPFQLPAVGDGENIMTDSDWTLSEIHRQAQDSPIIRLSMAIRNEGWPCDVPLSEDLGITDRRSKEGITFLNGFLKNRGASLTSTLLCGQNRTRVALNRRSRILLNRREDLPMVGEKMIVLKNNPDEGIMNGTLGTVTASKSSPLPHKFCLGMKTDEDRTLAGLECYRDFLNQADVSGTRKRLYQEGKYSRSVNMIDYGYCLSVHKAQGSEWDLVLLMVERNRYQTDEEFYRWMYTGVTRAKKKLLLLT